MVRINILLTFSSKDRPKWSVGCNQNVKRLSGRRRHLHRKDILLEEWRGLLINQILLPEILESRKRLAPVFRDAARVYSLCNGVVHPLVQQ